jgi:hypothetical protein
MLYRAHIQRSGNTEKDQQVLIWKALKKLRTTSLISDHIKEGILLCDPLHIDEPISSEDTAEHPSSYSNSTGAVSALTLEAYAQQIHE